MPQTRTLAHLRTLPFRRLEHRLDGGLLDGGDVHQQRAGWTGGSDFPDHVDGALDVDRDYLYALLATVWRGEMPA